MLISLALTFYLQGIAIAADSGAGSQEVNNASQPIKLSLEDAIKKGVKNSAGLASKDISIKKLWRVTNGDKSFKELTADTQKQLDEMIEYHALVQRKGIYDNLSVFEEEQILKYREEYGDIPPPYSRQSLMESYLNGRAFSSYSSWLQLLELKDTYDTSKAKLEADIQAIYYNVLYHNELSQSLEASLNTMEKQYSGIDLKYKNGLITELDKSKFELDLNKKRLEVKKQKRRQELQELILKQECGIAGSQKIELTSKDAGLDKEYRLDTYKNYVDKALAARSEVVNARLKAEVYKKELEYYDKYINQKYAFARTELESQIEDADFAVIQNNVNVNCDIQEAYIALKSVQSQMEIEKRNALSKKADYNAAEKKYSQGQLSLIELLDAKDAANNAEIVFRKAQREVAYSFYRLEELACKLGPGYQASAINTLID